MSRLDQAKDASCFDLSDNTQRETWLRKGIDAGLPNHIEVAIVHGGANVRTDALHLAAEYLENQRRFPEAIALYRIVRLRQLRELIDNCRLFTSWTVCSLLQACQPFKLTGTTSALRFATI